MIDIEKLEKMVIALKKIESSNSFIEITTQLQNMGYSYQQEMFEKIREFICKDLQDDIMTYLKGNI